MAKIISIKAKQILDSRGQPTVEAILTTEHGIFKASVPSGVSKGKYEAVALPIEQAIKNVQEIIAPKLEGRTLLQQKEIDQIMIEIDGTEDKSRLGANAILAVSMACCRAGAAAKNLPLYHHISSVHHRVMNSFPLACFNIIEGGAHSESELDIQEFMAVPQFDIFAKNFQVGKKIYQTLKQILQEKFGKAGIKLGDEAGFAPPVSGIKQALGLIMQAITHIERSPEMCYIGLDCAASQFYKDGKYNLEGKVQSREGLVNFYQELTQDYPIVFLEDPFAEGDVEKMVSGLFFGKLPKNRPDTIFSKVLIIGDDLTATNPERIKQAHKNNACQGVVIKPNQIGTVSETIEAVELAKSFGWKIMVSHRSGETEDDFIADLAVGIGADFIKAGAPATPARLAKYNRLLQIEKQCRNISTN